MILDEPPSSATIPKLQDRLHPPLPALSPGPRCAHGFHSCQRRVTTPVSLSHLLPPAPGDRFPPTLAAVEQQGGPPCPVGPASIQAPRHHHGLCPASPSNAPPRGPVPVRFPHTHSLGLGTPWGDALAQHRPCTKQALTDLLSEQTEQGTGVCSTGGRSASGPGPLRDSHIGVGDSRSPPYR